MFVLDDLKRVYRSKTKADAKAELETFSSIWKKTYPAMVKQLLSNQSLFSFYDFPEAIRPSLYTTNLIEAFNKHKTKAEMKVLITEYLTNYYVKQIIHTKFNMTPLQFQASIQTR